MKPSEIISECIAHIEEYEMKVGAWSFIDRYRAINEASELDKIKPEGPLFGIPFGVKDNIDTHDMPTAHGTSITRVASRRAMPLVLQGCVFPMRSH